MSHQDFLVELGTEELPPKALQQLSQAFLKGIEAELQQAELNYSAAQAYASPRRLAVVVEALQTQQADIHVEKRGPAVAAAFDSEGLPTKALQGFARSCGVEVDALQTMETDKGKWLVYREQQPGQHAATLLPTIVQQALAALPIPKRMRWGNSEEEFVRPVHWLVMLLGETVVPATILGVEAQQMSRGHRFHQPAPFKITSPASYLQQLREQGHVMADSSERRETIQQQVAALAQQLGGEAVVDAALLDEVTGLVEWPTAIAGKFDQRFLELPPQALISSMQGHQKYFPVANPSGGLLPFFITVSNIESTDPAQVIAGNERVIRPRLSDAAFFWETDCKQSLTDRQEQLKTIVFQNQLGTVYDKSQRVAALAGKIAPLIAGDKALAQRAGILAKCDLVTEMVGEFPELQGIMGRYYAALDKEDAEVVAAMDEQYLPRFAGDALPTTKTGQALSIAEKVDTICGLFGIGQPPSGTKDPFALRRAAIGVLRILIEKSLELDLQQIIKTAIAQLNITLAQSEKETVTQVSGYFYERLKGYAKEVGYRFDEIDAVNAVTPNQPIDFMNRLAAVKVFRTLPEADALSAANKRIDNILKKNDATMLQAEINVALLQDTAEIQLASRLAETQSQVAALLAAGQYQQVLLALAPMRQDIDRFFDEVMVMAEDKTIRENRLALLAHTRALFLGVADISHLQS